MLFMDFSPPSAVFRRPVGPTLQNARTSKPEDELCQDLTVTIRLRKKLQLLSRPAEMTRAELRRAVLESRFFTREPEELGNLPGVNVLAAHAAVKIRGVQFAAANRADAVQHLLFPVGVVSLEPILEKVFHGVRQPQRHVAGVARAGLGGG